MQTDVKSTIPFGARLRFATIGILAGNAVLLILWLPIQNGGWDFFALYAICSIPGWVLVGVPIALTFPARLLTSAWRPVLSFLIGVVLGPLALLVIFIVMFVIGGSLSQFSLANTKNDWLMSIPVSTVSFLVYAVLLRRRLLKQTTER